MMLHIQKQQALLLPALYKYVSQESFQFVMKATTSFLNYYNDRLPCWKLAT